MDDDMVNATLTIIYDDAATDMGKIKDAMQKADFPIDGEPEQLKP